MLNAQSILDKKGPDVATIDRGATVLEAAKIMNERRIGALVVVSGDRAVGVFTERDIVVRVLAAGKRPAPVRGADADRATECRYSTGTARRKEA